MPAFTMLCSQCFNFNTCAWFLIDIWYFASFFSSICFLRAFTTCCLHYYFLCRYSQLQQKWSSCFCCYLFVSFILLVLDLSWTIKVAMFFSRCMFCWLICCKSFLQVVQMQLIQQHSISWRWLIEVFSHTCCDVLPSSLIDSNVNLRRKQWNSKGLGARSLARNTLGVEGRVGVSGWE